MTTEISQSTQHASPPRASSRIRLVSSFLPLILLSMLLGASLFQVVVDMPNWTGLPALEHYRAFYQVTNPGTFFQILLPLTLLALLVALGCNWRPVPATRWRLAAALGLLILVGVITFMFHFPRNKILFEDPLTRPAVYYHQVVTEWAAGDYIRQAVIATAIFLVAVSMIRIARDTAAKELQDLGTRRRPSPTSELETGYYSRTADPTTRA